jgi:hypothetical protein
MRNRAINRKCGILKKLNGENFDYYCGWIRNQPGRLAKGKIHCSCWMCRRKSYDEKSVSNLRDDIDYLQQIKENNM